MKKPRGKGVDSEQCVHMHAVQWLTKSGIWDRLLIFHVANERQGSVGAAMHFKRMGVRAGVADFLAFPAGKPPLAIEMKNADGELRPTQIEFQRKWEAAGGTFVVCRTLEEFQAAVAVHAPAAFAT